MSEASVVDDVGDVGDVGVVCFLGDWAAEEILLEEILLTES